MNIFMTSDSINIMFRTIHSDPYVRISPLQQALSDQELSALQILAMRRRMKLGDLESDDEPPVRREPPAAAPAPGLDTGLFMGRIERVEHQVQVVCFCLLHHSTVELISVCVILYHIYLPNPSPLLHVSYRPHTQVLMWNACVPSWTS